MPLAYLDVTLETNRPKIIPKVHTDRRLARLLAKNSCKTDINNEGSASLLPTDKSTKHPSNTMADQQRPQGLLKFQVHHWKQENVGDEEFAKWYTEEFIPRSVKILTNYGVEQYKLVSP